VPPTNCSAVHCPHTVFFSALGSSIDPQNSPATTALAPTHGPWSRLYTTVPHHRVVFSFANGTHRGFDSEIPLVIPTDKTKAELRFKEWTYDNENNVVVHGQGTGVFDLGDVDLQIMYKVLHFVPRCLS
jgi:hypothetical protein